MEFRLTQGIKLLRDMRGAGVMETIEPFTELKTRISEWVKTGNRWEGRIEFPTYGRYADVRLPKTGTATLAFKMHR